MMPRSTRRRADAQALRQKRALTFLAIARGRRAGPEAGGLVGADFPLLALLDAVEHAANLARLARGGADPADPAADTRWRRRLVAINAVAAALAADVRSDSAEASLDLYQRIARKE